MDMEFLAEVKYQSNSFCENFFNVMVYFSFHTTNLLNEIIYCLSNNKIYKKLMISKSSCSRA